MNGNTNDASSVVGTLAAKMRSVYSVKVAAVLVVAVLLAVGLVSFLPNESNPSSASTYGVHTVTYVANNGSSTELSVNYSGIILSEYNPTYWAGTVDGANSVYTNWTGASTSATYVISASKDNYKTVTFDNVGITYSQAGNNYTATLTVNKVFCGWNTAADGTGTSYYPGALIPSSVDKLYAQWTVAGIWYAGSGQTLKLYSGAPSFTGYTHVAANGYDSTANAVYTHIYTLTSDYTFTSSATLPSGTIRSASTTSLRTISFGQYSVSLTGDTIFDNIRFSSRDSGNHADESRGLFATGHLLILGTGINSVVPSSAGQHSFLQVFGGGSDYTSVSSTNVIIHSGIYSNVAAGSCKAAVTGDTHIYIKGATILDTLLGGSAKGNIGGSVYVYATGLIMTGDTFEETQLGTYAVPTGVTLTESGVFTGGSNNGEIKGSTNIFLSGDSEVWDMQGAGRRANSVVDGNVMVEISGNALVKHVASTSITDGNHEFPDKQCIKGSATITLTDNARAAAIFGAGFDAFYAPSHVSMYGTSITVNIEGGTVGYVYGAGYRGTVGTATNPMTITVNIKGGVILGDVFGGGRGGVDKVCHTPSGTISWGEAYLDTTGSSVVYGNITVNLTGGAVQGNVYGGGESVPALAGTIDGNSTQTAKAGVAQVYGNITINESGTAVSGNIYGAGKGVDTSNYSSAMYAMNYYGAVVAVTWITGSTLTFQNSALYAEYAMVTGQITVNVTGGSVKDVYGGGQSSIVSSTAALAVSVSGGSVAGSVYGGGQYGAVTASTVKVAVSGNAAIAGSVYGGGQGNNVSSQYAKVTGNVAVTVSGGTIGAAVYGGGCGVTTNSDAAFVTGNVAVTVSGGTIGADVYGGGAYGRVGGNLTVTVSGGLIKGSVYGGGLGYTDLVSTTGTRTVVISGGRIRASVFGGTALGNDGTSGAPTSHATVYVAAGTIDGNVCGGGYKGVTYGNTNIYIGYNADGTVSGQTIAIALSVYGGGDVGEVSADSAFTKTMVYGNSNIYVYGKATTIAHSIFGSGNSSLTSGATAVYIENYAPSVTMESIQRADLVIIKASTLKLEGRSDGIISDPTTRYAFNRIADLQVRDSSTLHIYAMINQIKAYTSGNASGDATEASAPGNTMYLCNGVVFSVKYTDTGMPGGNVTYGKISGYTILAKLTTEKYYGAFAYGALSSTGGFVIESAGSFTAADYSDFANCRCWYIKGTAMYTTTALLKNSASSATTVSSTINISLPVISSTTSVRYIGCYASPATAFQMVLQNSTADIDKTTEYAVLMGASTAGTNTSFNGGSGVYMNDANGTALSYLATETSAGSVPIISFTVTGCNPTSSGFVGYVTAHFQEVYESTDGSTTVYLLQNSIDVKIEIYKESKDTTVDDSTQYIYVVNGAGKTSVIIPRGFSQYGLTLTSTTAGIPVYLSTSTNAESSLGWDAPLAETNVTGATNLYLARTNGSFPATVDISVKDVTTPTEFMLYFHLASANGDYRDFAVKVIVTVMPPVSVTFVDTKLTTVTISVDYGTQITEADCPATTTNFVGWYTDSLYYNAYNYSTSITSDLTLYACYMYAVTFDNNNGTSSTVLVDPAGSCKVPKPTVNPTKVGYTFDKWYADAALSDAWDFTNDTIAGDTTIYAGWIGNPVTVTFRYAADPSGSPGVYTQLKLVDNTDSFVAVYGSAYGSKINDFTVRMTAIMGSTSSLETYKFIRWTYTDTATSQTVCVYSDTIDTVTGATLVLTAEFAKNALQVTEQDTTGDTTVAIAAPVSYLVYADGDGNYSFMPGNATRTGYQLSGWTYTLTGGAVVSVAAGTKVVITDLSTCPDGKLILSAVWTQIVYTVTIVAPNGGSIAVTVGGSTYTVSSESRDLSLHYGDQVAVAYTAGGGYSFASWYLDGEGALTTGGASATLSVVGSCALYAKLAGLCTVNVYAQVDDAAATNALHLFFDLNGDKIMDSTVAYQRVAFDGGVQYGLFSSAMLAGTYTVYATGDTGSHQYSEVGTFTVYDGAVLYLHLYTVEDDLIGFPEGVTIDHNYYAREGTTVTLTIGSDYVCTDLQAAGAAPLTLTVAGDGIYQFSMPAHKVTVTGTVLKKITAPSIAVTGISDVVYDGSAHQEAPVLKDGSALMVSGTAYTLSYASTVTGTTYINVQTVTITITGLASAYYTGTRTLTYAITPATVTVPTLSQTIYTYTGSAQGPALNATDAAAVTGTHAYTVTGTTSATAVGNHAVNFTLDSNHQWSKDTFSGEIDWLIKAVDGAAITVTASNLTYSGVGQTPTMTVQVNGKAVSAGNYQATYTAYTATSTAKLTTAGLPWYAGNYKVTISVTGYAGNGTASFTVAPKNIGEATVTLGSALTYSGSLQTQAFTVGMTGWTDPITYTVDGNAHTDAGSYTMTVTGSGNYTGTVTQDWTISAKSVTDIAVQLGSGLTYTGNLQTQSITSVKAGDAYVTAYTVAGNTGTDAGSYQLTVTLTGNYTGTKTVDWTIAKALVSLPTIATLYYTGLAQVAVPDSAAYTRSGTYTATDAGSYAATVTIANSGNYAWTEDGVTALAAAAADLSWTIKPYEVAIGGQRVVDYNGSSAFAFDNAVTGVNGETLGLRLTASSAAVGTYTDSLTAAAGNCVPTLYDGAAGKAANYKVSIAAEGTNTLEIRAVALTSVTTDASHTYTGSNIEPAVAVYCGTTLVAASQYTVTYSNNKDVGTATVTVTAKADGDYTGTVTTTFEITALKVVLDWGTTTFVYNKSMYSVSATVTNLVAGDTVTLSYSSEAVGYRQATNVGTYTVSVTSITDNANYTIAGVDNLSCTWYITVKTVTIPTYQTSFTYVGDMQASFIPDTGSYNSTGTYQATNAGDYTATISLFDTNNYVWSDGTTAEKVINWSITKYQITMTTGGATKVYDGTELTKSGVIVAFQDSTFNGHAVLASYKAIGSQTLVGSSDNDVTYTFGTGYNADNFSIVKHLGKLEVTAASIAIKVTADSATEHIYDGHALTAGTFQVTGTLAAGDSVTATVTGSITDVGSTSNTVSDVKVIHTFADNTTADVTVNYTITAVNGVLSVVAKQLTVTGTTAADKTYDGTTAAAVTLGTVAGIVGTDVVTVTVTGAFDTAAVGTGKTVTLSYALTGAAAGNYLAPVNGTTTAAILAKEITVTVTAGQTKVYGEADPAFAYTLSEAVAVTGALARANGATVGAYAYELGTLSAGSNYTLTLHTTDSFAITAKQLTVTGTTAADKTYDGTTAAAVTLGTVAGIVGTDVVTVTVTGAFDTAAVGTGKTVTLSYALTGAAAGNYLAPVNGTTTAAILAKEITVTVTAGQTKVYGEADPAFAYTLSEAVAVTGALARANGATVGAYAYELGTLSAGSNYTLTLHTTDSFAITAKQLTVTGTTAADKTYDGTTAAAVTLGTVAGIVGTDVVTVTVTGAFDTAAVGTGKTVTLSYALTGAAAGNYLAPVNGTTTAAILAKEITVTVTAGQTKVYGEADPAFAYTLSEAVAVTGALARANGATVGAYAYELGTLSAGSNYTLTLHTTDSFAITAKQLTVTGTTAADKTYDGTTAAAVTLGTVAGIVGTDVVTVTVTGAFDTAAVGTGKTVTLSYALTGAAAGNYLAPVNGTTTAAILAKEITVTVTAGQTKVYGEADPAFAYTLSEAVAVTGALARANGATVGAYAYELGTLSAGSNYTLTLHTTDSFAITAKQLTVTGTTAADKTYDGTTAAAVTLGTVAGIVGTDVVTVTVTGAFDTAAVGTGKTVTLSYALTGAAAGNYLAPVNGTTTAAILAKEITVTVTAGQTKVYGEADPAFAYTLSEAVAVTGALARANGATVGAYAYELGTLSAGSNYTLTLHTTDSFAITAKQLTVTGTTAADKTYDGTTAAAVTLGTVAGIVGTDVVTVTVTGAFDTAAVGTGKTVTLSYALTGAAAGNYLAPVNGTTTAAILAKEITVTVTAGQTKVYGEADPAFAYTLSEAVAVTGALARANGATVGAYAYELGTLSAGSNYTLTLHTTDSFAITAKQLTVTGTTAADKTYDGTTAAAVTLGTVAGIVGTDVVTVTVTGAFDTAAVGTGKTVTLSYALTGAAAGNYLAPVNGTTTAAILAKEITVTVTAGQTKVYGEADPAFAYTLSEAVAVTGALARANGATVGAYAYELGTLSAGSNYTLTLHTTDSFAITAKQLTVTGTTAADKTYDGTTAAAVTLGTVAGIVGTDVVTVTVTGAFDTAAVGTGKTVTLSYALTGAAAGNYLAPVNGTTTAAILAKEITVTVTAGQTKVYGEADPAFAYTLSEAVAVTGALARANGATVGAYAYELGTLSAGSNYTLTLHTTDSFAITAKQLTVTGTTAADKTYDGTTAAAVTLGTVAGIVGTDVVTVTVTGAFDTAAVGTGKTVTLSYALTGAAAGNYLAPVNGTTTAAILAKEITVTVTAGQTKVYGEADPAFAYTLSEAVAVTGALARANGATVGAYAYELGTLSAGSNYTLTLHTTDDFTIKALAVSISWSTPTTFVYNGNERTVIATITNAIGSDSFTLVYADNAKTTVGEYTAKVTTLGNANYTLDEATGNSCVWFITPATIEYTAVGYSGTYDGAEHSITVTAAGCTITYGTTAGDYSRTAAPAYQHAGSSTVYYQITKENYTTVTGSATVEIAQKALVDSMVATSGTYVYNGTVQTVTYTVTDGTPSIIATSDYTVSGATGTNAGSYTLTVTAAANGNYSGSATATWSIGKADMTVTAADVSVVYDGAAHGITVTGYPTGATVDYGTVGNSFTAAGTYTVAYTVSLANYNDATGSATVTIGARPVALAWSTPVAFTYDGSEKSVTATITNLVSGDSCTLTYADNAKTVVGEYTASVSTLSNANYTLTGATGNSCPWAIEKAAVTVTAVDQTVTYGDAAATLTATVSANVVSGMDAVNYTLTTAYTAGNSVGNYAITVTVGTNANYTVTPVNGTITVGPKGAGGDGSHAALNVVVGSTGDTYVYNGSAWTPSVTVSDSVTMKTLVAETDYKLAYTGNIDAGTATVTITGIGNYTGSTVGHFTITPYKVEMTWAPLSFTYNGAAQMPTATFAGVNGEVLTMSYSVRAASATDVLTDGSINAGSYTVTAALDSVTGGRQTVGNYSLSGNVAEYTIGAASLSGATVNGADQTYEYTGEQIDPAVAVVLNGQTLVAGTDYTVSYSDDVNAGSATVTITGIGNYAGSTIVKIYTIHQYEITVTVTPGLSKVEGEADPAFTYTLSHNGEAVDAASAFIMAAGISGTPGRASGEAAGHYAYTLGTMICSSDNYKLALTPGSFTVISAAPTYVTVYLPTGAGYSIYQAPSVQVEYGSSFAFAVDLETAYTQSFITVTANGVTVPAVQGVYTLTDIVSDTYVSVTGVSLNVYGVVGSIVNGTVDKGNQQVFYGSPSEDMVFTAADGYIITAYIINDQVTVLPSAGTSALTFKAIDYTTEDVSIEVITRAVEAPDAPAINAYYLAPTVMAMGTVMYTPLFVNGRRFFGEDDEVVVRRPTPAPAPADGEEHRDE